LTKEDSQHHQQVVHMKKIAEITLAFFVGFAFGFSFRRDELL